MTTQQTDTVQEDQGVSSSRSQPCANGDPCPVLTETQSPLARQTYRGWTISYDPPPIPVRDMDWHFIHPDFDASWDGEEDGYVSNGLAGHGASVEDCKAQIDDIEADRLAALPTPESEK